MLNLTYQASVGVLGLLR